MHQCEGEPGQAHIFLGLEVNHLSLYSRENASDNFEVWLDDFLEALKPTNKASWNTIVLVFSRENMVSTLTVITAYQHCHELRYGKFVSGQGLLAAMRDYQCMAPSKLTDVFLLWNKVCATGVKEIPTDGSVNTLLKMLLRAEAVIQACTWQTQILLVLW